MNTEELIDVASQLKSVVSKGARDPASLKGPHTQVVEFFRTYAGPKSAFADSATKLSGHSRYVAESLISLLDSYIDYLGSGLLMNKGVKSTLDSW